METLTLLNLRNYTIFDDLHLDWEFSKKVYLLKLSVWNKGLSKYRLDEQRTPSDPHSSPLLHMTDRGRESEAWALGLRMAPILVSQPSDTNLIPGFSRFSIWLGNKQNARFLSPRAHSLKLTRPHHPHRYFSTLPRYLLSSETKMVTSATQPWQTLWKLRDRAKSKKQVLRFIWLIWCQGHFAHLCCC